MARIVMTDDGIVFDGATLEERPLGGAETSFIEMANALAARGHEVLVCNKCEAERVHKGVTWRPLSQGVPESADLYIPNRGDRLIRLCPNARRTIFWIHNPAGYLLKWRYQWKLALRRPVIVFSGASHASTYPAWGFAGGRETVPYGLTDLFCHANPRDQAPPPRVVFTSNPMRGLDWLLDIWERRIRPAVPNAELHVFAGTATYGAAGAAKAGRMGVVLDKAAAMSDRGVVLRGPVPKTQLVDELAAARALLYRGDIGETFCSAVAEAQAMGVPAVLGDIACMNERVIEGETGHCLKGDDAFAEAGIRILTDDSLWRRMHLACLEKQRSWRWDQAAAEFERIGDLASSSPVSATQ
ncbi:Glycosyltransferase [Paramagnetospirillum magnetotacticum MS-1]|uniref:Glycosyltransferase n=1 Tax=Paramagnetospirillum magnetotacticum MS-1 TaxID=272627 RepID=A0A0C2UY05_PARME|nr:glycosyltransferase [Paramagnetospirillum magnetotacticum]KIL97691.1 Glycosyltransferase [Paramagnetospirillum magnetotacticum MS-1]